MESEQRVLVAGPVVASSRLGASALGDLYWVEVERLARGLLGAVRSAGGIELRLLRGGPRLLVLGPPELSATEGVVRCRHPILGGVLTRRPGGSLSLSQAHRRRDVELRSTIAGFYPALGRGPGWAGPLYGQVQSRIHVLVSRRFFRSLTDGRRR